MCVFPPSRFDAPVSSYAGHSLAHQAQRLLHASSYSSLRGISCDAHDGIVYLHGRLPTQYLKQLAQEIVFRVKGAFTVVNRIEVETQNASNRASY